MMDLKFKKLKSFGSKDYLIEFCPYQLSCTDNLLLIADYSNMVILILTLDLQYRDCIQLDFRPITLNVLNKTICINGTCFYDLDKNMNFNDGKLIYFNGCLLITTHSEEKLLQIVFQSHY